MKNKILSLLLTLCILSGISLSFPITASAVTASGTCGDNLTWTLEDGTLTIKGSGAMYNYDYSEDPWHSVNTSITEIKIKYGVTTIGDYAFDNCSQLLTVSIPGTVTSIGYKSFRYCSRLTEIEIPNSVTVIGDYAFRGCTKMSDVKMGNKTTSIGTNAFYACHSLTKVTVPDTVRFIGEEAFTFCESLTDINVEEKNSNYASVDGVLFNKSKTVLMQYPIGKGNETYYVPDTVTDISRHSFSTCRNLKNVVFGKKVKTIEGYAFYNCMNLESVTFTTAITTIKPMAFDYCKKISNVYYYGTEYEWNSINIGGNNSYLKNATIHLGATKKGAFGENLFWELDYNGVLTISGNGDMPSFEVVPWEDYINDIVEVYIENGVTNIGWGTFSYHESLKYIYISDTVKRIEECAFSGCSSLESIVIPEGITEIPLGTFEDCSSLISIDLPNSIKTIGQLAFVGCSFLPYIRIPDGATKIEMGAFARCSNLKQIVLPKSIKRIESVAFNVCNKLSTVYYLGTDSEWKNISIGGSNELLTSCYISRDSIPVSYVEMLQKEITVCAGATELILASCKPYNATDQTLKWSSSNPAVATVSSNGSVYGKNVGKTTITARSNNGKTASCIVNVTNKAVIDNNRF